MKRIALPFLGALDRYSPIDVVAESLHSTEKHAIVVAPWVEFPYQPEVYFQMAYAGDAFFLKYEVKEDDVRAIYREINQPVYRDSCVEFFITLDGEESYYNFEFNCLGTALVAYGPDRNNRQFLPVDKIKKIRKQSTIRSLSHTPNSPVAWELILVIPFEVFPDHQIANLRGGSARVNFYKCGDDLPKPHYLAWNNVETPDPDFHQPEFFGEVLFN